MLFFRNFPTCFYGFRNSLLVRRTECGQWKGRAFFCTSSTVRRVAGALRAAEAALRVAEAPVLSLPTYPDLICEFFHGQRQRNSERKRSTQNDFGASPSTGTCPAPLGRAPDKKVPPLHRSPARFRPLRDAVPDS